MACLDIYPIRSGKDARPEAEFLPVMIKENGTDGFNRCAVSVKILWREIPESVIVADMPGMKDGDSESLQNFWVKQAD